VSGAADDEELLVVAQVWGITPHAAIVEKISAFLDLDAGLRRIVQRTGLVLPAVPLPQSVPETVATSELSDMELVLRIISRLPPGDGYGAGRRA